MFLSFWGIGEQDGLGVETGKRDVPEDLRSVIELDAPFDLATMAFPIVGRHDCSVR